MEKNEKALREILNLPFPKKDTNYKYLRFLIKQYREIAKKSLGKT